MNIYPEIGIEMYPTILIKMKRNYLILFLLLIGFGLQAQESQPLPGSSVRYYRLINRENKEIIPPVYTKMEKLSSDYLSVEEMNNRGVINKKGKTVVPADHAFLTYVNDKLFIVGDFTYEHGYQYGVVNERNKVLLPFEYEEIKHWKDDLFFVKKGQWGVINLKGEEIQPMMYNWVIPYDNGLAAVRISGRFAMMTTQWELVTPFSYEPASFNEGIIVSATGLFGNFGAYDLKGNTIVPYDRGYNWISPFVDGYAYFQTKEDRWGVINDKGEEIIPAIYSFVATNTIRMEGQEDAQPIFSDGLACVADGYDYGAIDKEGSVVIPFIYNFIYPFRDGCAIAVNKQGKYGVINTKGEEVIPFRFDRIDFPFVNGYASAVRNISESESKMGIIDIEGNIIMPFEYTFIQYYTDDLFISEKETGLALKETP